MSKVLKCQMCHSMANVKYFGNFLELFTTYGIFWGNICYLFAPFRNFHFSIVVNFCHLSANFAIFWHPLGIFHDFWQMCWQFCHVLATCVGNFKHLWADFGIFWATFGCSHKLLATFLNFLSL